MADDITTEENVEQPTGADEALPEQTEQQPAADEQPASEPSEESTDGDAESAIDDKLRKFAQSQNIDLDSPGSIRAAQVAMKAQSEATKNYRRSNELEKSMHTASDDYAEQEAQRTGQDPEMLKRLQRMEVKEAVRDFWNQEGVDRSLEPKMAELVLNRPHLAGDLDALYALAERSQGNVQQAKSQGGRQALESLAHKQQAAVPTGHATNPNATPKQKPFKDMSIAEMEAKLGFVRR